MNAYDEMVLKIVVLKGKEPLLLATAKIVEAVQQYVDTLSEEEKDRELVRLGGKPPIKVRDFPKAIAEDKSFQEFWVRKSIAYYNEFLRGKE